MVAWGTVQRAGAGAEKTEAKAQLLLEQKGKDANDV